MKHLDLTNLYSAKNRIAQIRGFYNHVAVYLVVNMTLLLLREKMTFILLSKRVIGTPELLNTIDWDVFGIPIIWGIALIFHAISVFGAPLLFGRKWEERQLKKYFKNNN